MQLHEIKEKLGLNRFLLSAKKWIDYTNAIGIKAKAGRYGGTYAHADIAFHFCLWLSPRFQLYPLRRRPQHNLPKMLIPLHMRHRRLPFG